MANDENLKPAQPGEVRNPNGRPPGSRNRSTVARQYLEMMAVIPTASLKAYQALFPDIVQRLTSEEMMTLTQISKAITKSDTNAYRAVMDSAYGMAKQPLTGEDGGPIDVRHKLSLTPEDLKVYTDFFEKNF